MSGQSQVQGSGQAGAGAKAVQVGCDPESSGHGGEDVAEWGSDQAPSAGSRSLSEPRARTCRVIAAEGDAAAVGQQLGQLLLDVRAAAIHLQLWEEIAQSKSSWSRRACATPQRNGAVENY